MAWNDIERFGSARDISNSVLILENLSSLINNLILFNSSNVHIINLEYEHIFEIFS